MPGSSTDPSRHLALALALALAAPSVAQAQAAPSPSATIPVGNCNDAGAGSLRAAVASAADGDTIDLRSLQCRQLLLTSGAIHVTQDDLTMLGPTRAFTIDGNAVDMVFLHTGSGTLRLRALSIANGNHEENKATGGCIHSDGDLRLEYVRVHDCRLYDSLGYLGGGGAIAANDVALYDSEVFDNVAYAPSDDIYPLGGGILAHGDLALVRSRVNDNTAQGGYGGGVYTEGGLQVRYSEVSGNFSRYYGGLYANTGQATEVVGSLFAGNEAYVATIVGILGGSALVVDTTVSGNTAGRNSGLQLVADETSVVNSTIVDNVENQRSTPCGGALVFTGDVLLESTIVARNRCGGVPLDITGILGTGEVMGSDNLVQASTLPLPPDTISANPRISPLADNGGRTRTHALWAGSPAVDMGNNNAGLAFDQRGPGFDRVKGARADIGAYER
ncbi:MAG TPA: choice-of-anchor Q domain-containing protein [Luteimonas sp.]|nr:choice-of-anchor Q domain-containing protein [Luteimonas sp.]